MKHHTSTEAGPSTDDRSPTGVRARILLDCDPGIDDAMALALVLGTPSAELVGVTTVAGNVPLSRTTANALRLTEFFGSPETPVVAGSALPLTRPSVFAEHVHGSDGLGGAPVPEHTRSLTPGFGPDFIIEQLAAAPGEITLIAIGPMTNVALAVRKEPRIVEWAREFVIMGGSYTRGNITPAAEFNFFADPEAAAVVFGAGWSPVLIGLDLTLQARIDRDVLDRWRAYGPLSDNLLIPSIANYFDNGLGEQHLGPAVHDACAVAYCLRPDLFRTRRARTNIETAGAYTSGMSVVDFGVAAKDDPDATTGRTANSLVATELDTDAFWDVMSDAFAQVTATMTEHRL
ncbi:purine nucleosidase [Antricoccus suffuscus]|uniref:Purine nucleosidase n=1 Tax=Antricoccus suffuscus TaxID=1629062 RepID=A0A2T0ZYC0_9ACTN|nr:nucleoside hydrolase [Antricoccus suffuscus]PRZ41351.1 purine nucleosidase [Antricoccus suffuscus]